MTPNLHGWEAFQRLGALTHTRITWVLSPMAPQVPGVTPGSPLCPWCCGHSLRRGARHSHSSSHFLLPYRGCSPYIATHFPWIHTLGIVVSMISGAHFLLPVHPTVCTFTAHLRLPQSITAGPAYRRLDDTHFRPSHCCLSIGHSRIPSATDVLPQVSSPRQYPCPDPGIGSRYRSSNYSQKSLTLLKTPCQILHRTPAARHAHFQICLSPRP